jgi:hypothetical protein
VTAAPAAERTPGHNTTPPRTPRWARVAIAGIVAMSVAARVSAAWRHPGFITGDDWEIHMMTLGHLWASDWEIWSLRSAFYPMAFIYPAQALVSRWAGDDPWILIFTGRLVGVAIATLTLWVAFRITERLTGSWAAAVAAATLIATSRLHLWFAASELPRPVAAAFLLAAFAMLLERSRSRTVAAGVLLGVGGALRFGELAFIGAAVLQLVIERRARDAILLSVVAVLAAVVCIGGADWLYWGTPFSSFRNTFVYTLVNEESTRGFQPPLYYLSSLHVWTNLVLLAFGVAGAVWEWRLGVWMLVPLVALSVLPHKEARYMVPLLPFLSISAAVALWHLSTRYRHRAVAVGAVAAVALIAAIELKNWQYRQWPTDQEVRRIPPAAAGRAGILAEDQWTFGGPLYLRRLPLLRDVTSASLASGLSDPRVDTVLLREDHLDPAARNLLAMHGFTVSTGVTGTRYAMFVRTAMR